MKAHLKDSDTPLVEGQDQVANCGAIVPKAAFVFMWDSESDVANISIQLGKFCRGCAAPVDSTSPGKRYMYALLPGEEVKHSEEGG